MLGERIKVEKNFLADKVWLDGDASLIDQMVMNLSVNARDAMPQGGSLVIETAIEEVSLINPGDRVLLDARKGWFARVSVRDSGVGMSREVMDKMFDPFFTTKPVGKGTGLGLSIVHSVVQQHSGWIRVRSEPGAGAEFSVFLPHSGEIALDQAAIAQVTREAARSSSSRTRRLCGNPAPRSCGASGTRSWRPAMATRPCRCGPDPATRWTS
jgi:signal transduction histidine kinase